MVWRLCSECWCISMNTTSPPPSMDDITAVDAAVIRGGVNTATINTARKTEELVAALKNSRARLQTLKTDYVAAVKADGGGVAGKVSGKRRMIFYEITRTFGAMESLKNELTQRGAAFEIDVNDYEHPNAAFKRMTAPKKTDPSDVNFWYFVIAAILLFLWFLTGGVANLPPAFR
jgi:hypothetical protein